MPMSKADSGSKWRGLRYTNPYTKLPNAKNLYVVREPAANGPIEIQYLYQEVMRK